MEDLAERFEERDADGVGVKAAAGGRVFRHRDGGLGGDLQPAQDPKGQSRVDRRLSVPAVAADLPVVARQPQDFPHGGPRQDPIDERKLLHPVAIEVRGRGWQDGLPTSAIIRKTPAEYSLYPLMKSGGPV
jgi:hypothetical protein